MKICMLVTNSIKKDPRVRREAESASANEDNEVVVIGCNDPNYDSFFCENQKYAIRIYDLPIKYKLKLHSRINKAKRMVYPVFGMYKICLAERPDVVHANDFDTLPIAVMVKKKTKCKVVYDSHEIYTEQPSLKKYPLIKKVLKCIEARLIKKADYVISVSHAASKELGRMYGIQPPTVVTNCSKYYHKENLPPKNDRFEVIYHGIVNANRGYEEFAEAGAFVDDGVYLVVRGMGERIEYINSIIREKGLNNARIDDPVEIPELIPCAAMSMVGVVLTKPVSANYKYTVSNKIFEYIQARIPVIMSDVPEHRYLNERYQIGIIIKNVEAREIADAVNKLYRNEQLYNTLCENVDAAARRLCWEKEYMKLEEIYLS